MSKHGPRAYLYKALRIQLNGLVIDLNNKIVEIINGVNADYPQPMVIFANPNPSFNTHRFCEDGIIDPDAGNEGNYLFLASWPDYDVGGSRVEEDSNVDWASTSIPDSQTCASTSDWADLTLCAMGAAGEVYNGESGLGLNSLITAPDGSEIEVEEIPAYIPTNWAKTFRPRSQGQQAYSNLVRSLW